MRPSYGLLRSRHRCAREQRAPPRPRRTLQ
jgi:hypothetical protein